MLAAALLVPVVRHEGAILRRYPMERSLHLLVLSLRLLPQPPHIPDW